MDDAANDTVPVDLASLMKALTEERRIRLMGLLIERPRSQAELAAELGLGAREVALHRSALERVGLVESVPGRDPAVFRFNRAPLIAALKSILAQPAPAELGDEIDAEDRKVLGNYLVEGRLKQIPAQQKKRDVVLRFLADKFEPQRMYQEKEVNAILREYHDDVASLRRYLVDTGLLNRQIVRVVGADALMEGQPEIEYRNTYWKPDGFEPDPGTS